MICYAIAVVIYASKASPVSWASFRMLLEANIIAAAVWLFETINVTKQYFLSATGAVVDALNQYEMACWDLSLRTTPSNGKSQEMFWYDVVSWNADSW